MAYLPGKDFSTGFIPNLDSDNQKQLSSPPPAPPDELLLAVASYRANDYQPPRKRELQ